LMDMPALFDFDGKVFMGITEAALVDYAGMYLSKQKNNSLISKLSPWPTDTSIKVQSTLPHKSPWRVLLISDTIGDLIESNIITSLNEPCKIENTGWIKPGKTTFPWWNGNVVPDTINAPGNNFVTNQYYIDFCARNNIQYHSVVEYGLHQWYADDGVGFQPGPNADVTKPVPGLNMKEICDYAKSKGVDVRVWVHFYALYPKLDTAFALFEKWGLSGMMVDFMDRDDQQMVNMQNEILQKAAKHKLHIQFHGAYKSTGLHRTWPNEFTREGTLNYEANKWASYITPDMDIDMPFTRMLAGSTDYHLGGFRAVPVAEIKPNYTRPLMLGTRCHQLAMYVVLENYLQMVCDYPEAYEGQPGFEFIKAIPTTWDEIKVLTAKPDEYIVIARRKNNEWYIGAITNSKARGVKISFPFLGEGDFEATIFSDAADVAANPNLLEKKKVQLNKDSRLTLQLSAGGGAVMQLIKK
jgi:alpha-glucosidase